MRAARWNWIWGIGVSVGVAVCCSAVRPVGAEETDHSQASSNWVAIPSGIADPDGQSIYVTGSSESLTALDLATGEPRWETKEAQLALAVVGDKVIARTSQNNLPPNAMQVVVLDAATGKVTMRCRQIVFPDWVAVGGGLGLSFDAIGSAEDNLVTLTWRAARELAVAQGKATPEMIASAKKTGTGTAVIDLETGENKVAVDSAPRQLQLNRKLPFYDVGDKRLYLTQRSERLDGGIQLIHRTLEAREQKTGKPVWQQPIAGEVYLPVGPPPAVSRKPTQRGPTRR